MRRQIQKSWVFRKQHCWNLKRFTRFKYITMNVILNNLVFWVKIKTSIEKVFLVPFSSLPCIVFHRPCCRQCISFLPSRKWEYIDRAGIECLSCNGDGMGRISDYPSSYFLWSVACFVRTTVDSKITLVLIAKISKSCSNKFSTISTIHSVVFSFRTSTEEVALHMGTENQLSVLTQYSQNKKQENS